MAAMDAEELNRRFGVPGLARVVLGSGGLTKVVVSTAAASGEIYLHGAHVTSWKPASAAEVLFVSPHSLWQGDKAIRGGVPICFPWFGDKAGDPHAPAHGFVRTRRWELQGVEPTGDGVSVCMVTESDADTKTWWPADFHLLYRATFGAELKLELIVTNKGAQPLQFEEALHAYFHVGDATQARISGLDDTTFQDKTDSFREKPQNGDVVISRETDRVYLNTAHPLELHDPVLKRELRAPFWEGRERRIN